MIHGAIGGAKPGNDIVVTKWVGLFGTVIIVNEMEWVLNKRFSPTFIKKAADLKEHMDVLEEIGIARKHGATAVYDEPAGGIFGALWKLAEDSGTGLEVELKSIPIRQETIEISELFEINPYKLLSGGSLLITANNGYDLVRECKRSGINAAVIGKITEGNDRIVFYDEKQRFLTPVEPSEDDLYKIYGEEIISKYRS